MSEKILLCSGGVKKIDIVGIEGGGVSAFVKDIPPRTATSLFGGIALIILGIVLRKK